MRHWLEEYAHKYLETNKTQKIFLWKKNYKPGKSVKLVTIKN